MPKRARRRAPSWRNRRGRDGGRARDGLASPRRSPRGPARSAAATAGPARSASQAANAPRSPPVIHIPLGTRRAAASSRSARARPCPRIEEADPEEPVRGVLEMGVGVDEAGKDEAASRSTTSVDGPRRARTSMSSPTARMRSPDTATARASGREASTVQTLPLWRIRSAAPRSSMAWWPVRKPAARKATQELISSFPRNLVLSGARAIRHLTQGARGPYPRPSALRASFARCGGGGHAA